MGTDTDVRWPALVARGLRKSFGTKVAVAEINLDVPPARSSASSAPTARARPPRCAWRPGLLRPDRGQVWVDGIDVWADPIAAKARIGVLPEDLALFERLSGRELLEFHGLLRNMRPTVVIDRAGELLDLLGLTDAADALVVDYSHGMRKKLVLAAAMLHGPRLLFLDEPFEAIDPVSARAIRIVLEHFTAAGATIVFSSHVMELVERMCDHVAVMVSGRIVWSGPLDDAARRAERWKTRSFALVGEPTERQGAVVVGTFVRLKLRLLRNGLGVAQGAVLFALGAFGAARARRSSGSCPSRRCGNEPIAAEPRDRGVRQRSPSGGRSSRCSGSATTRPSTRNVSRSSADPRPAGERRARRRARRRRAACDAVRAQRRARRARARRSSSAC